MRSENETVIGLNAKGQMAYEAYIAGMGQKLRKSPAKLVGMYHRTKPKGARLWEELGADEVLAWCLAVEAVEANYAADNRA
jgi:hypothetical protein